MGGTFLFCKLFVRTMCCSYNLIDTYLPSTLFIFCSRLIDESCSLITSRLSSKTSIYKKKTKLIQSNQEMMPKYLYCSNFFGCTIYIVYQTVSTYFFLSPERAKYVVEDI